MYISVPCTLCTVYRQCVFCTVYRPCIFLLQCTDWCFWTIKRLYIVNSAVYWKYYLFNNVLTTVLRIRIRIWIWLDPVFLGHPVFSRIRILYPQKDPRNSNFLVIKKLSKIQFSPTNFLSLISSVRMFRFGKKVFLRNIYFAKRI